MTNKQWNEDMLIQVTRHGDRVEDLGYNKLTRFKCNNEECQKFLSPATIKFYGFNVTEALCYDHQLTNNK